MVSITSGVTAIEFGICIAKSGQLWGNVTGSKRPALSEGKQRGTFPCSLTLCGEQRTSGTRLGAWVLSNENATHCLNRCDMGSPREEFDEQWSCSHGAQIRISLWHSRALPPSQETPESPENHENDLRTNADDRSCRRSVENCASWASFLSLPSGRARKFLTPRDVDPLEV